MRRFCREEYEYYDGLPAGDPNHIDPSDVLATVSVNSFVRNAEQVRRIHRGMATYCDDLLATIPQESVLLTYSRSTRDALRNLLHAAVQASGVLIPVATKVLHRKRPSLIPMLDNVILTHYLNDHGRQDLLPALQDKCRAADVAMTVLDFFLEHLKKELTPIEQLRQELAREGYVLTQVRIVEVLVWIYVEERGYYRESTS
jgi:hypothetical protein